MNLRFCDVDVSFGSTTVLRHASGALPTGGITGLLGPNGAGKSTLLRALAGLQPTSHGTVLLDDIDAARLSIKERARLIATVPQTPAIDFHFDVLDVAVMGRHPHLPRFATESAHDMNIARAALRRTGVAHLAERDVTTLSGGERQLVFIAKAIAQETPILLLDEPISALDVRHQLQVLALLRDLADEGRTVAAALHDVSLAARICDHLLVIDDHRVVAAGSPPQVVTASLMRDVFRVEAEIATDARTGTVTATAYHPVQETS